MIKSMRKFNLKKLSTKVKYLLYAFLFNFYSYRDMELVYTNDNRNISKLKVIYLPAHKTMTQIKMSSLRGKPVFIRLSRSTLQPGQFSWYTGSKSSSFSSFLFDIFETLVSGFWLLNLFSFTDTQKPDLIWYQTRLFSPGEGKSWRRRGVWVWVCKDDNKTPKLAEWYTRVTSLVII